VHNVAEVDKATFGGIQPLFHLEDVTYGNSL